MTEKRVSAVSFTNSESQNLNDGDHPSDINDEETAQISLDPCVQTYLAKVSQQSGCWGRYLPIPFERAASKSWWDPMFDSEILEDQFKRSASNHNKIQFRYVLWYLLVFSSLWFISFLATGIAAKEHHWPQLCTVLLIVIVFVLLVFLTTYTNFFNTHLITVSFCVSVSICLLNVIFVVLVPKHLSAFSDKFYPVGHFAVCTEILLLIYTMLPLRMYICTLLSLLYSVTFELSIWLTGHHEYDVLTTTVRYLTHICIHLIGLHILIMNNVRMRNTFMKVGHSLLVRRQLESEKKLKENMIHSLMPPGVANWLMSDDENFKKNGMEPRHSDPETGDITKSLFRPFNMNRMENVSILFADIVGFTKMSSTKTAEELVDILNNLFQRFDLLCKFHNCEKISTLGDCYYCVSGCPDPVPDHAKCCVEMGLSMIQAIKQFDQEKNEGVNMRVGIHTGTILCGIVGTRRFKFDVWSNDVTLANSMESTSKPGMVHISEQTKQFLPEEYLLDEGPQVSGLKTYFILGRKYERVSSYNGTFKINSNNIVQTSSLQLIVSPPTSPPSMSPQTRPRVLSCDTSSLKPHNNPNQLSPDVCKIKANSLPSILDSENDHDNVIIDDDSSTSQAKTPTSTASSGKTATKMKTWKIPKFLKKLDAKDNATDQNISSGEDSGTAAGFTAGYHQVPTIIETHNGKRGDGSWTDISQCEFEEQKDVIDIKSYISQSRSDIAPYEYGAGEFSHFMRTGSYRSQYGRSPNDLTFLSRAGSNRSKRGRSPNFDIMPSERARSITVSQLDRGKTCLEVPHRLSTILLDDQLSMVHSINSRKDSGIRSNSRKSSIQPIEHPYPQSDNQNHRVSGYFTSSQSTINSPPYNTARLPGPLFGKSIQNLRKQSDRQLIKCVQDNTKSKHSYFTKPPLSNFSLFFEDRKLEQEYRKIVHAMSDQTEAIPTLANSKFNTCFDIFVSLTIFLIVSLCLFLLFKPSAIWIIAFSIFLFLQICGVALCTDSVSQLSERAFSLCTNARIPWLANCFFRICTRWYRWNTFGGILVSLPLIAILINFHYPSEPCPKNSDYLYNYLLFIGVIHFCNFTQLNCWMRNILVTALGIIFMSLVLTRYSSNDANLLASTSQHSTVKNSSSSLAPSSESHQRLGYHRYDTEIFLDLFLLILLVWILNRQFEKGYRLSFHAHFVANRDKMNMLNLKNQADWLIYNIVPEHVAEQLKKNAAYSENFKNVGIIFASIVNFNEMYDESYLGGKEFLRVLNELIGDFDELLRYPEFHCIEKIKTIGSTFMAAGGLNSKIREEQADPNEHLYALMDFALAMQDVVENFNRDLLEFNLMLRIGYNFGDVTAAVIGNTKLYYDIWGDAVNISSRMDSTGVNGRIQVGEHCLSILEKRYSFQKRGSVYVKGKDNMDVYLLLRKNGECGV